MTADQDWNDPDGPLECGCLPGEGCRVELGTAVLGLAVLAEMLRPRRQSWWGRLMVRCGFMH